MKYEITIASLPEMGQSLAFIHPVGVSDSDRNFGAINYSHGYLGLKQQIDVTLQFGKRVFKDRAEATAACVSIIRECMEAGLPMGGQLYMSGFNAHKLRDIVNDEGRAVNWEMVF